MIDQILDTFSSTIFDILPIMVIIFGFQFLVIRKPIPNLRRTLVGFVYVLVGLALFLVGLEEALFPLGKLMAQQLTDPGFILGEGNSQLVPHWTDYYWVYLFGAAIGFATALAEPSLIAVAIKANQVSGGAMRKCLRKRTSVIAKSANVIGSSMVISPSVTAIWISISK